MCIYCIFLFKNLGYFGQLLFLVFSEELHVRSFCLIDLLGGSYVLLWLFLPYLVQLSLFIVYNMSGLRLPIENLMCEMHFFGGGFFHWFIIVLMKCNAVWSLWFEATIYLRQFFQLCLVICCMLILQVLGLALTEMEYKVEMFNK